MNKEFQNKNDDPLVYSEAGITQEEWNKEEIYNLIAFKKVITN